MNRASRPSIAMLPPIRLPIRLPTVEKRLSDTSEPLSLIDEVLERLALLHPADVVEHHVGHLVRGLRARRHRAILAGRRVAGAVAEREDARIDRRLQRVGDDDLVAAVGFQPKADRKSAPFTPAAQTIRSASITSPVLVISWRGRASITCVSVRTSTPSTSEFVLRRGRQFFGQGGQDARARFEQRDMHAALVEHFEPVMPQRAGRVVKLGGEFDARRAAADDRDADLLVGGRIVHHRPADAQAVVEQPGAKPVGLHAAVEVDAMFLRPPARRNRSRPNPSRAPGYRSGWCGASISSLPSSSCTGAS